MNSSNHFIFAIYGPKNDFHIGILKFFKRKKYTIVSTVSSVKKLIDMLNSKEPIANFREKALKINKNFWINMELTSTKNKTNIVLIDDLHELEKDLPFIHVFFTGKDEKDTFFGLNDQEIEIKIKTLLNQLNASVKS